MTYAILIVISILPAIILLWYLEKQDKGRKEPGKLKWRIFGWGLLATIFAAFIELNIEDLYIYLNITPQKNFWLYITLSAFVTAAFVEEALKLWVVKTHVYKDKNFDEVMDGITYTIIASLGFATFENVLYVLEGGFLIAIIRALISVPAHALFSGVMGYYIGVSRFAKTSREQRSLLWKGLGFGILYHGLFDFLLFSQTLLFVLVLPLMVIMGMHLKSKIKKAHFADKVTNVAPQKITAKKIFKGSLATILIFLGIGSFMGSIILVNDNAAGYTLQDILISGIFCVAMLWISYYLLRTPRVRRS